MIPFDLIHTPLTGVNLIEAAAGTGKTYTIEGLFLRLVLEAQLPVERILVVTFTRAATAELRDRIYRRLAQARDVFLGASDGGDELLRHLAARQPDSGRAARWLRQALMDFDRAAIFTIHGFCQRVLYEHAFEAATAFDGKIIQDQAPILAEVVEDFWRQRISGQPPEFLQFAKSVWREPGHLLELARRAAAVDIAMIPRRDEPGLQAETLAAYRLCRKRLKTLWPGDREQIGRILREAPLNGRNYGTRQPGKCGEPSKREQTVRGLLEAMDAYCADGAPHYPAAAVVSRLASSTLSRCVLNQQAPPSHPVFSACDALLQAEQALAAEMRAQLHYLQSRLVDFAPEELERRRCEKGLLSFDDLLRRVARALEADRGNVLARAVRERYQAALVDEFQDTDDLQYAVFSRLFSSPPHLLFMIGDPKQAIYGFRGADIFSYLRAAQSTPSQFTLVRNWRSTPGLVRAVNSLFAQNAEPFLFPGIHFIPGKAARSDMDGMRPAMVVWHLDSRRYRDDGRVLAKSDAQVLIARAVAAEIQRLTADRTWPGSAGQIAVLVRTNRQAALMNEQLSTAGVPAVIYSTANVFDSAEARDMAALLSSLAEPQNALKLKSALATHLLGASAGDIAAGERSANSWEPWIARHEEYLRLWIERGFMAMFRRFLAGEAVKQRLLGLPQGERRLTNVQHLAELLQAAAADGALGVTGLVQWLRRQIEPHAPRPEETQLRLESDAHAVKIVTVHRSKGLEYPIVFCPFAWSGSTLGGSEVYFHDPENDDRLTVDLSGARDSRHRIRAQNELLAENLRMLYVAVTRAQQRCYLAWGRINTADTSALAYLLRRSPPPEGSPLETDWIAGLQAEFQASDDEEVRRRLEELALASHGAIEIRPLPLPASAGARAGRPAPVLACRSFRGKIDPIASLTSYSALASAAAADAPDHDADPGFGAEEVGAEEPASTAELGIHDFPAGARAGTFFHSILEALDFTAPVPRELVSRQLKEFGFEPSWEDSVCRMLGDVLSVPVFDDAPGSPVRLAEVSMNRRVSEMEFYFPLNLVTPARLEEVFSRWRASAPVGAEAPPGIATPRLHFAPTRGFMKGFIDLVFEHRGRYYLIDWKSNRLGAGPPAYRRCRLDSAMRAHFYDLQYHIYTLALHQYLRSRVPAYRYARHFGGVCYVFLRGVSRLRGPGYGLFCDRPEPRLVHALGKALIPDYD